MTDENSQVNEQAAHPSKNRDDAPQQPTYGRLASDFPHWDPYVYGKPEIAEAIEQPPRSKRAQQNPAQSVTISGTPTQTDGNATQNGAQGNANSTNPFASGPRFYDSNGNPVKDPFEVFDFDPNDPKKNPMYNRWDFYAIIAFIGAFFAQTTLLSLFLAFLSLRRTKALHMKGRTLAIIAIVLCVLQIALYAYLVYAGMTEAEFLKNVLDWLQANLPQAA
ncbi:hypothetical protein [Alloscardovia criceti]|uniref:hypothetical protein n=1 Tax=Alloscardovia criceti TaxID=356828 RepID=UPI00037C27A5|nr:hypothetical protein [Alloscardovia criceti]